MSLAKEKICCAEKKLLGDQNEEAKGSSTPICILASRSSLQPLWKSNLSQVCEYQVCPSI